MKKRAVIYFGLLAIFALIFAACTKDDDTGYDNSLSGTAPFTGVGGGGGGGGSQVDPPYASASCSFDASFTVRFTNQSTNATSYKWVFGDGTTSTEVNPIHTYVSRGVKHLTLYAYNSAYTSTATADINMSSYITLVNNSSDPYAVQIDNIDYGTISGNNQSTVEVNPGSHHVKVVQQSGYIFYATVKNYDIDCYAGGYITTVNFPSSSKNAVQTSNVNIQSTKVGETFENVE